MGIVRHKAIVVVGSITRERAKELGGVGEGDKYIDDAHRKAEELFEGVAPVTKLHRSEANSYRSFVVLPDGSKEGWPTNNVAEKRREEFKAWLDDSGLIWKEVKVGVH